MVREDLLVLNKITTSNEESYFSFLSGSFHHWTQLLPVFPVNLAKVLSKTQTMVAKVPGVFGCHLDSCPVNPGLLNLSNLTIH